MNCGRTADYGPRGRDDGTVGQTGTGNQELTVRAKLAVETGAQEVIRQEVETQV